MALADILNSFLSPTSQQGLGAAFGQTSGAVDPGQSTAPGGQTNTPLSELLVQSKARQQAPPGPGAMQPPISANVAASTPPTLTPPGASQDDQGPPVNYSNSGAVSAANSALTSDNTAGQGRNSNVYGLLPHGLQHGTLSSILGMMGDAMLVGGGRQPEYLQRMQNQEMGQATAGMNLNDPASVQAATQRLALTGDPGSNEMAQKDQELAEQAALRQQTMEYNNNYREQMVGVRNAAQQAQAAGIADRYRTQIGPMLSSAKDPATYAAAYNRLAPLAKQIGGPTATPGSLWSIPEPGTWTPGILDGYGMTANNIRQTSDRAASRNVSMRNADVNAGARVGAASVSANRPSDAQILQNLIAKQNSGQPLAPAEQAAFNHLTQVSHPQRGLAPGVGGGVQPKFIENHTYRDAKGNLATYINGKFVPH